jgi:hypothetical protein
MPRALRAARVIRRSAASSATRSDDAGVSYRERSRAMSCGRVDPTFFRFGTLKGVSDKAPLHVRFRRLCRCSLAEARFRTQCRRRLHEDTSTCRRSFAQPLRSHARLHSAVALPAHGVDRKSSHLSCPPDTHRSCASVQRPKRDCLTFCDGGSRRARRSHRGRPAGAGELSHRPEPHLSARELRRTGATP